MEQVTYRASGTSGTSGMVGASGTSGTRGAVRESGAERVEQTDTPPPHALTLILSRCVVFVVSGG